MQADDYRTTPQLARAINVARQTVNNWIRDGKIRACRVGNVYRIPIDEFRRVVETSQKPIDPESK